MGLEYRSTNPQSAIRNPQWAVSARLLEPLRHGHRGDGTGAFAGRRGLGGGRRYALAEPACSQTTALPAEGQAHYSSFHERRTVACGHVRPQAVAPEIRGTGPAGGESEDRAQDRRGVPFAVQVPE